MYTCISEECADPPQLFARFDDWKRHMDAEHTPQWMQRVHRPTSWCCDRGHDVPQWYTTEPEFDKHVKEEHADYADGAGLDMLKEWCGIQRLRGADVCPVCNCIPKEPYDITTPGQPGQVRALAAAAAGISLTHEYDAHEALLKHVAEHVKQVGFMSIEYLQDNDEGGMQASGNASGGADDHRDSLEDGKWIDGEWVPTDPKLAAYIHPDLQQSAAFRRLLASSYDEDDVARVGVRGRCTVRLGKADVPAGEGVDISFTLLRPRIRDSLSDSDKMSNTDDLGFPPAPDLLEDAYDWQYVQQTHATSTSQEMWNTAYDSLKEDSNNASLVTSYVQTLRRALGTGDQPNNGDAAGLDDPDTRQDIMKKFVEAGQAKIATMSRITKGVGNVVEFIQKIKPIVDTAIGNIPQAALPWAGVCVGLQVRKTFTSIGFG